ncbi:MAG: hypothetical protein D6775_08435, partial [Caldilineae bacterium]
MLKHRVVLLSLVMLLLLTLMPTAAFAQGEATGAASPPGPMVRLEQALLKAAAETLGMEPDAFVQSLRSGKTPAELATEQGVAIDDVIAALQNVWNKAGARLIDRFVHQGLPLRFRRPPQPDCVRQIRTGMAWTRIAADTVGLDPAAFLKALRDGATPAEIAQAHG